MLTITVPAKEFFDEKTNEFFWIKEHKLVLEHSLVSISKWEAKWQKPFLDRNTKLTPTENLDYIRCMTLTQNVDPKVYLALTKDNLKQISDYIASSRTATWFSSGDETQKRTRGSEVVTSELIYYWMVAYQIPFECQKWHINRLLTLIRICDIKNQPPKKMNKNSVLKDNRAINEARKARLKTKG